MRTAHGFGASFLFTVGRDYNKDDTFSDTSRTDRDTKPDRPRRDFKRKDDDLILPPAPDRVKGFGDDVPGFLKR